MEIFLKAQNETKRKSKLLGKYGGIGSKSSMKKIK